MQAPGQVQHSSREGSGGSGEGLGGFGTEPGQVQQGFREGSEEGLEGFGAVPGQVQQGFGDSGEGSRKPWCKAKSGSTGFRRRSGEGSGEVSGEGRGAEPGQVRFNRGPAKFPEKVGEALVQSQVRFNRVPEKVPVKVWEALVQSQVWFNRVPEKVAEKVWEALVQSQVRFNRVPEKVPVLGFAARFRKICKNKTLRLLGIPPKLILIFLPSVQTVPAKREPISKPQVLVGPCMSCQENEQLCRAEQ